MADSFDTLHQLRINDRPIYCPQVQGALAPGNWVLFKYDDTSFQSDETDCETSIGLIMSTADDGLTLVVNLFLKATVALMHDLRLEAFPNPNYRHVPQILRTPRCLAIKPCAVTSICWVFQRQDLDNRPHEGHQGMSNLFLLNYNDQGGYLHIDRCHPFCSSHDMYDVVATSCYPERVWNGLQVLRSEISRQLGRFSEKQGTYTKTSSQVVLGREAWSYLLSKVATAIRPPIRRHTSAAKRVLESGLELKSLKQGFSSLFVRFETEEELRVLSTVLGELIIKPYARKTVPMIFQYGWKSMASLSPAAVRPTTKGARLCESFSTFRAVLLNSALDGMREPLYGLTCFVSTDRIISIPS